MLAARHHRRLAYQPDPRDARLAQGWIDLGSAGLPAGPPPQVAAAVHKAAEELQVSPESGLEELRERLARHVRVDRDRLVIAAGADLLLRDLLAMLCDPDVSGGRRGNEVVFATPAADGYRRVVESVFATPVPVLLTQGRQDFTALTVAIDRDRCRAVLVSNPHIPTGVLASGWELEMFLDGVPADVLVVLDETHRESALHQPAVTDVPDGLHLDAGHPEREGNRRNVAVLRSWDTAHGFGALPVGYLAADPQVAATLAKTMVSPAVSLPAVAAATATLEDAVQERYREMWEAVAHARSRLCAELRLMGFAVPDSGAGFVWMRLGALAQDFAEHCARHRIHVGVYPQHGVRVRVGLPQHIDAFLAAAQSYLAPSDPAQAPQRTDDGVCRDVAGRGARPIPPGISSRPGDEV